MINFKVEPNTHSTKELPKFEMLNSFKIFFQNFVQPSKGCKPPSIFLHPPPTPPLRRLPKTGNLSNPSKPVGRLECRSHREWGLFLNFSWWTLPPTTTDIYYKLMQSTAPKKRCNLSNWGRGVQCHTDKRRDLLAAMAC